MPESSDQPQRHRFNADVHADSPITIIIGGEDGELPWFRVFDWFYDQVVPTLTASQLKVMLGMFRHRDRVTGLVNRSRQQFAAELRLPKQTLSHTFLFLLGHPARLLAEHGPSLYEPLPGRTFAGRKPETVARSAPPPISLAPPPGPIGGTVVQPIGPESNPLDQTASRSKETRARQPNQEEREIDLGSGPEDQEDSRKRFIHPRLAGWQGYGLFWDLKGITDVREALGLLRVGGWLLEATAKLPRLTVAEISEWVEKLNHDPSIRNRPVMLCRRLHEARGLAAPQPPQAGSVAKHIPDDVRRLIEIQQKRRFGG